MAGDAANSGLITVMNQTAGAGTCPTFLQPPGAGREPMAADDIAVVETWMDEGALDN